MGNKTLRLIQEIERDLETKPVGSRIKVATAPRPEIWERGDRVWMNTDEDREDVMDHAGMASRIYTFNPYGDKYDVANSP